MQSQLPFLSKIDAKVLGKDTNKSKTAKSNAFANVINFLISSSRDSHRFDTPELIKSKNFCFELFRHLFQLLTSLCFWLLKAKILQALFN